MSAIHRLPYRLRLLAPAALAGVLALTGACGNYQLALQGTATPTAGGALGVRQLPPASPQAVFVDPAAIAAAQAVAAGAVPVASATAAAPAAAAAASPALAQAAPARPAIGDIPAGSAAAAPVLPTATPTAAATARTAAAPRTATPMPSFTAPAAPRATSTPPRAATAPSPSPAPSASPSPARPTTVQVYLPEGVSDFMYAGRTLPADQALAALAGAYDVIYFKPAGAAEPVAYRPGIDSIPALPHNTLVRIGMKKAMSFVMQAPQ